MPMPTENDLKVRHFATHLESENRPLARLARALIDERSHSTGELAVHSMIDDYTLRFDGTRLDDYAPEAPDAREMRQHLGDTFECMLERVDWRTVTPDAMRAVVAILLADEPSGDLDAAFADFAANEHRMMCACCRRHHEMQARTTKHDHSTRQSIPVVTEGV